LNIKSNQSFTKQPNTRSHENSTENSELTGSALPPPSVYQRNSLSRCWAIVRTSSLWCNHTAYSTRQLVKPMSRLFFSAKVYTKFKCLFKLNVWTRCGFHSYFQASFLNHARRGCYCSV